MTRATLAVLLLCAVAGNAWAVGVGDPAPDVTGREWINTAALTRPDLAGKVVLVEFWTYGCWNCRNVEPYVKQWHARYKDQGLVVIGVHTPEFDHERQRENVSAHVHKRGNTWPIVMDNDYANWNRYQNRYWPAFYLRDRKGIIRYVHYGEGKYRDTEAMIMWLLGER